MPVEKEIGRRVLGIREDLGLSQKDAAAQLGVSLRSWQSVERGENVPSGETLLKFQALGFNAGWVLSGLGPKRIDGADASAESRPRGDSVPESVMVELVDLVLDEHQTAGIRLRHRDAIREATALYNEILSIGTDVQDEEEVRAVLPVIRLRLKKRVSQAVASPGTGKRSAS